MNKDVAKLVVDSWDDKKVLDEAVRLLSAAGALLDPSPEDSTVTATFGMGMSAENVGSALVLLKAYREKKFGSKGISTLE